MSHSHPFPRLTAMILILSLLSGCGLSAALPWDPDPTTALGASEGREVATMETLAPLYPEGTPSFLWGRSQLTAHAQRAYDRMSAAIAAYGQAPVEVDLSETEIDLVLEALRIDHPEYFWFDGKTSFVTSTLAGVAVKTECTFTYTMTLDQVQAAHAAIDAYTAECLNAPEVYDAQTDYQRILGVYRYLIRQTDYVRGDQDQSILGVMVDHRATCAGYARSFQYLMGRLGIPCVLALGEDATGEAHGWNMVQCGGAWYQMDVTWGDPVGSEPDEVRYTYCMVTDGELYRDHRLTASLPMPACHATLYNYYVQSGLEYDRWDAAAYEQAMEDAVAAGARWFAVRFSTDGAYEAAREALFTQEELWSILYTAGAIDPGETHVSYIDNDLFREISVELTAGRQDAQPEARDIPESQDIPEIQDIPEGQLAQETAEPEADDAPEPPDLPELQEPPLPEATPALTEEDEISVPEEPEEDGPALLPPVQEEGPL